MYVRHPPEEHDDAAHRRRTGQKYTPPDYRQGWKPDGESKSPPNDSSKSEATQAKLELCDKLKQVLCTNLCLSESDVNQLIAEAEK